MSTNIAQMREYLINYPKYARASKWINRVMSMPDNQVIAVYMRLSQTETQSKSN